METPLQTEKQVAPCASVANGVATTMYIRTMNLVHKRRMCSDCNLSATVNERQCAMNSGDTHVIMRNPFSRLRYRFSVRETSELSNITDSLLWLIIMPKFTHTAKLTTRVVKIPRLRLYKTVAFQGRSQEFDLGGYKHGRT